MNKVLVTALLVTLLGVARSVLADVPNCPAMDPSGAPIFLEDPTDCGAYYECSNGLAVRFICPSGTYYNSGEGCDWAEDVDCGVRPTTLGTSTTEGTTAVIDLSGAELEPAF